MNKIKLIGATVFAILAMILLPRLLGGIEIKWSSFSNVIYLSFLVIITGLVLSVALSQIIGRIVAKMVVDSIVNALKKGLTTATDGDHRLSDFEIKAVKGLITRTLKKQLSKSLILFLFLFYIFGVIFLMLEVAYLIARLK